MLKLLHLPVQGINTTNKLNSVKFRNTVSINSDVETHEDTVSIQVNVTDENDDPVKGAIVTIGGQSCANGTGSSGGCTVKDVPIGTGVNVSVTCDGYETYTATEDITSETTSLSITLTAE